ncbi:vesicular glutamate transporter 3-like isoform X2 [Tubulanus polymorphus]|uniref:vesicular glutamate transporter 3-like isoform X2 n=1 Tax=Tubulanus polymorphus TaxID=672921 RepID=UPI003DA3CDCF
MTASGLAPKRDSENGDGAFENSTTELMSDKETLLGKTRRIQDTVFSCSCCFYVPKRYVMVAMCFLGMFVIHSMRVNVAVAILTIIDAEPRMKTHPSVHQTLPTARWTSKMVGFLHSIFYVGFLVTQIPGGFLATKLPGHRLFGGSILTSCVLNLLLPVGIDKLGYEATCAIRLVQGLSEGLVFPACYTILRHWVIPPEQSRQAALVLTGVYAGAIVGFPVSGLLTHFMGWQYVFYFFAGMGIVWFLLWLILAYERPAYHPYISMEEKKYIESSQGDMAFTYEDEPIPWKKILSSIAVVSLCVCHFSRNWMFFLLLTMEPAYLNCFGFTIAENGILSSLPHVLMVILSGISGHLADWAIRHPRFTKTQVRKIFTCVGFGMESLCSFILVFMNTGATAMTFLTIGVGFSGFATAGWQISHLDIAPRYASVLVGMSTTMGTVGGILSPLIVGFITHDQSLHSWQMSFILTGGVLAFGVVFYAIFGTADRQPWADPISGVQLKPVKPDSDKQPYQALPMQTQGLGPNGTADDAKTYGTMESTDNALEESIDEKLRKRNGGKTS